MANWVFKGIRTGIKTTSYPKRNEQAPGISPGRPVATKLQSADAAADLMRRCPTGAIRAEDSIVTIDHGRCVHCLRCKNGSPSHVSWVTDYEWSVQADEKKARQMLAKAFGRSLHIRFLDAGACGACVSEARQLNNPYYNMHRLGFFTTPTPRNADVLLVAGPVSDAMRLPLKNTYDAMPRPKRVLAIGACAMSGGVFDAGFATAGGVAEIIPVDTFVPGCPPPPLAILHGLLTIVGRKPPTTQASVQVTEARPI